MINKITFEIETITPMFLAGADQSKAELRAASIKGLLRFWWRALQAESDIGKLHKRESQIFGSSDENTGGGCSFSLRIRHAGELKPTKNKFPKQNMTVTSKGKTFQVNILEYLAYGTLEYRKGEGNIFVREYIPSGVKFELVFNFFDVAWKNEILKVLYVFSLFGGIGSRSRNGFGSVIVLNAQEVFSDSCEKYPLNGLVNLISNVDSLSYPSFTRGASVFRTKESTSWDVALAEVGKLYRSVRSGEIKIGDKTFENKHFYDKRQYMGAPLIVDKKDKSFLDRHAKPYFIKVAKEGNQYRSYILYLPSQYCTGLSEDRNKKQINHSAVDRKFTDVCNEFNTFLSQNMETIL